MADTYPLPGTGTTIAFGTLATNFTALVRDVSGPSISRAVIDLTHNSSATVAGLGDTDHVQYYADFKPGIVDMGEIVVDIVHDPNQAPPINDPLEIITLTFPPLTVSTADNEASWACKGFCSGYEPQTPYRDAMTGRMTLKLSGAPTYTTTGG